MAAFEHAVALGYTHVETDVHTTADGVLVAFHDDRLDRVTDRTGAISELTWAEVSAAEVVACDGTATGRVPLLEDILGTFPDVRVNVDPKADSAVEPLAEVITRTRSVDRVCVGAFSDTRIARVRGAGGRAAVLVARTARHRRPRGRLPGDPHRRRSRRRAPRCRCGPRACR